jgi:hypothetical protein
MSASKIVITDFGDPDYSLESEQFRAAGLDVNLIFANSRSPSSPMPTA